MSCLYAPHCNYGPIEAGQCQAKLYNRVDRSTLLTIFVDKFESIIIKSDNYLGLNLWRQPIEGIVLQENLFREKCLQHYRYSNIISGFFLYSKSLEWIIWNQIIFVSYNLQWILIHLRNFSKTARWQQWHWHLQRGRDFFLESWISPFLFQKKMFTWNK